ncbi:MAG TPA: exopolysaccharide biosynthesis polyprenyl glycosylphosphotransferase [Actinobacteria bacterium]|nr:exopolysaccharide biosynthesis polyprenyl glycosylphosphotransferase [Actinomycetota bacterium]
MGATVTVVSRSRWKTDVKRLIDIVVSGMLLVLLSPLLLIIAILVKSTSRGPVFYNWHVVGWNNRDIKSYKFRSMVENADDLKKHLKEHNEMDGPVFKIKNDPRITKVGAFLRKFSIDELPQFYSVLKGDMSLVGPRPPNRKEVDRFKSWHMRKLSVKPGITCLWQVNGRNQITDFDDWVKLDLHYIDNWSLWLDLKILFKTVGVVLAGTGR